MTDLKVWLLGLALIIAWFGLGTTYPSIGGINVRIPLYALPATASFLVAYLSESYPAAKSISLVIPIVILGPLVNMLAGLFGYGTDFPGISGLQPTFWIFLATAIITIIPGLLTGLVVRILAN